MTLPCSARHSPFAVVFRTPRHPITREVFCSIRHILSAAEFSFDAAMFSSACSLVYFGFLRVGEFKHSLPFNPARHLRCADIELPSGQPIPGLCVRMKVFKSNLFMAGHFLFLASFGSTLVTHSSWFAHASFIFVGGSLSICQSPGQSLFAQNFILSRLFESVFFPQFSHWCCQNCDRRRCARPFYSRVGSLVKSSVLLLYPDGACLVSECCPIVVRLETYGGGQR